MDVTLDHVVLEVRDSAAAAAFYEKVLGFAPVRLEEFRAGQAPFVSVRVNAATILDLFPPALWRDGARPVNPNHLCFTMTREEAQAVRERLAARGVAITQERPRNFGARGHGHSIYFEDPEGITLEVKHHAPAP